MTHKSFWQAFCLLCLSLTLLYDCCNADSKAHWLVIHQFCRRGDFHQKITYHLMIYEGISITDILLSHCLYHSVLHSTLSVLLYLTTHLFLCPPSPLCLDIPACFSVRCQVVRVPRATVDCISHCFSCLHLNSLVFMNFVFCLFRLLVCFGPLPAKHTSSPLHLNLSLLAQCYLTGLSD